MNNSQQMILFADQYLSPYKVKSKQDGSEEIIPELCPFCHGGDNGDKETFALSVDKEVYVCKRGTCGKRGHFRDLAEFFGDHRFTGSIGAAGFAKQKAKAWKLPDTHLSPPTETIYQYFEKRCISRETVDAFHLQSDDHGMIVFPFFENGVNVFEKFRRPWKPKPDEKKKEWRSPGTKPVLFGMDLCSFAQPLVITEGEIDAMSLYEAGVANVVSVPSGCEDLSWIENCWDWLEKFRRIVLFGDNDEPGRRMVQQVAKRLDESRCAIVEDYPVWENRGRECKDANEILFALGPFALIEMVESARQVPIKGLIDLGTVTPYDPTTVPRIKTMIPALDATIGGLAEGSITIFTGDAGCGKLLADDTVVMTRKGWKAHGSLVVGDEVVGRNGEFVKVQHVFPKYYANMEVTLSNGERFKCHENHEWIVELHSSSGYKERIKTAKELYDMLQGGYSCAPRVLKKPVFQGEAQRLVVKPYTLGVWLGDGRRSNPDICCSEQDHCIIDGILADGYDIAWHTKHKKTGVLYYGFRELREQLAVYGFCHSRRWCVKYIPNEYLMAPVVDRLQLLAGLIDTDGYYDMKKGGYVFSTTEVPLMETFRDLLNTLGIKPYVMCSLPKTSTSGVSGKKKVYSVGFITNLVIPCRVERKRNRRIEDNTRGVTIRDIRYCDPVPGNCIQVEGGIYCVGRTLMPTHNSTLTGLLLLNAIEQGHNVCAYSGELPKEQFQEWINLQCAGSEYIGLKYDAVSGRSVPYLSWQVQQRLSEYYGGKFFLFDNNEIFEHNQAESILEVFTMAVRRYGCKLFLVDNLMTSLSDVEEETRAQGKFIGAIKKFATRFSVHVLVVAHPRKRKPGEAFGKSDVSGNSSIVNLADSAIVVEKPNLRIIKNRRGGIEKLIECCYCGDSRRIYQADAGDLNKFSWNKEGVQKPDPRADSLPEYGVTLAQTLPF